MEFNVPKFISNLVENQFPSFYKDEGENFILFMKAYYEWMESDWSLADDGLGGPIKGAREIFEYRDIDLTIEKFLENFQKKYLYSIPFEIIANKRFLLKHILDVYTTKGTIQGYRLLFKLLYNEDVRIYLPGEDIFRLSDGTWVSPKYIELSANERLKDYVGKTIIGAASKVTATVETFTKENYNRDVINVVYISNIVPKNKDFEIGEKIVLLEEILDTDAINQAPSVLGSLDTITVVSGGQNYNIGDVIKIVQRDVNTGNVVSFGIDGVLAITSLKTGNGDINFNITDGGFGYTTDALSFIYKGSANGSGASFSLGSLTNTKTLEYNTDLICDYANLQLDATSYGFPANGSANATSNIGIALTTQTSTFGTIFNLDNILTGDGYDKNAFVFVRSVQLSEPLEGSISYDTSSNTVTGTSTFFQKIFSSNDVIFIQANSSLNSTIEYVVIANVVSNTEITLYDAPTINSTASAQYRAAPTILPSQYAFYETEIIQENGSIAGENETIIASPNFGNNIVATARAINSGKGYVIGETITAFLSGGVSNNITILESGSGYTNNELLVFSGGDPGVSANGYISTNSNGQITNATVTYGGSGYVSIPEVRIRSSNGSGASIRADIQEFNTVSEISATVQKTGTGRGRGYWSTTRSFLSDDKYLQDSYYYQDYSYEIQVAQVLNKYKKIINETFHTAGSELFGKYLKFLLEQSQLNLSIEDTEIYSTNWSVDSGNTILFTTASSIKADTNVFTTDSTVLDFTGYLSVDSVLVKADNRKVVKYLYASELDFRADNNKISVNRYYV
jgi:hypothetical protein